MSNLCYGWCTILMIFFISSVATAQGNSFEKYDFTPSLLEVDPGTNIDFGTIVDIAGETAAIDIEDAKGFPLKEQRNGCIRRNWSGPIFIT